MRLEQGQRGVQLDTKAAVLTTQHRRSCIRTQDNSAALGLTLEDFMPKLVRYRSEQCMPC